MPQIRFYIDEHVPAAVSKSLRRRGIDVLTTQERAVQPRYFRRVRISYQS